MKIFRDIINHWKKDWVENRSLFWLEIIGTLASVSGTLLISILIMNPPLKAVYSIWTFGSTLLCLSAYIRKASWFFVLMLFNILMNIVGLGQMIIY